jgi:hypothetical protein
MNSDQYHESLQKVLADRDLRILFWRLITEDCKVFQEDFPLNANAYALLAVQAVGKRLLADLKMVDPVKVLEMERDYNAFMEDYANEEGADGEEY